MITPSLKAIGYKIQLKKVYAGQWQQKKSGPFQCKKDGRWNQWGSSPLITSSPYNSLQQLTNEEGDNLGHWMQQEPFFKRWNNI